MKGDFSWFDYQPSENFTGVLEQQGRVRLDRDGLAAEEIARHLRTLMGRDAFGPGRVAVPSEASQSLRITAAASDGDGVKVVYNPGRAWIDGIPLLSENEITAEATYLPPPLQPDVGPDSIAAGVRDAVVLEVWEDAINGFQEPTSLLEPALGGVDTTERVRVCHRLRLRRLAEDEDCATIGPSLQDDPDTIGRLTVTPAPAIAIAGDCPIEAGGGYSGDGHRLFCIEIARPRGGGPRFVWSRHGGGLVGRGRFDAVEETIAITHNLPIITAANVNNFVLQALAPEGETGCWQVVFEATVSLDGKDLSVTDATGTWPVGPGEHAFFRLWDGVGDIADFTTPKDLAEETGTAIGINVTFDAPNGSNYREGDRWLFQARAAGTDFDPSVWPQNALPIGTRYHRAPLGILNWTGAPPVELGPEDIEDCRDSFPPLTDPCPCCTITVGDGRQTHGDEDSIEAAIERLPSSGGKICLLPGLHETNTTIRDRANIRIMGCGKDTRVIPRPGQRDVPIFHVMDSECIELVGMEMVSLGGVAILGSSTEDESLRQLMIKDNRIIACVRAIQIEGGSDVVIRENRMRMLDKAGAGVAIYMAAEDSRVEDNDIGVVPAGVTPRPPDDPNDDDDDGPDDPNDPCADEDLIFGNIGFFLGLTEFIFGFTLTSIVPPPYQALGGIQIGAGAERIAILDNRILGGAGHGITLGGSHIEPARGEPNGPISQSLSIGRLVLSVGGVVEDAEGDPAAGVTLRLRAPSGAVQSFTTDVDGNFGVARTSAGPFQEEERRFHEEGVHTIEPVTPGIGVQEVEIVQVLGFGPGSVIAVRITLNRQRETADPSLGFIYGIRIEDNEITAMGLNGIGIPPALAVLQDEDDPQPPPPDPQGGGISGPFAFAAPTHVHAREPRFVKARAAAVNPLLAQLGHPVIDLSIQNNRITGNLRSPFTTAMRDAAGVTGFGGISLGLCDTVTIAGNRIEGNGLRHFDPVCGIFILLGEQVEITDNLIRDNGPFVTSKAEIVPGQRGGVAGAFLSAGFDDILINDNRGNLTAKPALRLHDNVVQQPMGRALSVLAAGPVSITANHLVAERTGSATLDVLAGTVLVLSLSGIGGLPSGGCLINGNQIALGRLSGAFTAVALAAAEDLGLDGNQIDALQQGVRVDNVSLMLNTLVFAGTTRATGNRFTERANVVDRDLQVSLLSLSTRMNTATSNQGDHCIYVFDQSPANLAIDEHNQELDKQFCSELNQAAAGAALNPILGTANLQSLSFVNNLQAPTGRGLTYASALNPNLVALNNHQRDRIAETVEIKAANAALLGNEIARLEARTVTRVDLLDANHRRLEKISRDVDRLRVAREIVATKPEPVQEEEDIVIQGRVTTGKGVGLFLAQVQLADARGRPIDVIRPVTTNEKGAYTIRLSAEDIDAAGRAIEGGVTVITTPRDEGAKPMTSQVIKIDNRAALIPDIRIPVASDALPIRPVLIRPDVIVQPITRPILTPGLRLNAISGRIAPLLRDSRVKRGDKG